MGNQNNSLDCLSFFNDKYNPINVNRNQTVVIPIFYFCKPFHSWERGANENTNGLIRQYIPKGTDFSGITDEFVSWVENKLNNRPRKRLGYLTPNEKFNLILTN